MRLDRLHLSLALATGIAMSVTPLVPAVAQDAIGVASCDNFLKVYLTCVGAKVPADQRATITAVMEQTKANWKSVAATPDGKAKLDVTCKETTEKMKKEVAALNCAW